MNKRIVIRTVALAVLLSVVFGAVGAQIQRRPNPPPVQRVEYLAIPPHELGLDLNVARTIDYQHTTARLNAYAADGWQVRDSGMFDYAVVLLEREVPVPE